MSVQKAKDYYFKSGKGKLNCAQAVVAAFLEKFVVDKNIVAQFASHGSGKAPGGECGALYAAKFMLKPRHPGKAGECEAIFLSKGGSTKCAEIRKLKRLSCVGCVETAAELLELFAC